MKKYVSLPAFLMILGSCCPKYDAIIPPSVEIRIKVPSLQTGEKDSLSYHGLGSKIVYKAYTGSYGSGGEFWVPLNYRYKTDSCSFVLEWHEQKDTITIAYSKELIKSKGCFDSESYNLRFTPTKILKTSLDTTKIEYYASKNSRAISAIYATY